MVEGGNVLRHWKERGNLTSWPPKFIVSCPCDADHFYWFASKSVYSFSKYCFRKTGDRRTDERTDGQIENIMPGIKTHCGFCCASAMHMHDFSYERCFSLSVRHTKKVRHASESSTRSLRSSYYGRKCSVTRVHSRFGDRRFAAAGPRMWNNLPVSLRDKEVSCTEFRKQLKTFMF